ncbi:MAG: RdgB/HAM1 family non-canonical purine NTP pyrophosphatase [Bacteroidetes bacterium]|nr:RdgB/HAM1 family non-canonical purine NTP pyrophosphatase [Bacteroidota bacterium]
MNTIKLFFATRNGHKRQEVQDILGDQFKVVGPEDLGFTDDVEETGQTLEENAVLKAMAYAHLGIPVLADDSGLEIEALNGAPGVYSARFAGEGAGSAENMQKVLSLMKGKTNRAAQFKTVLAYFDGTQVHTFKGTVSGFLLEQARGTGGFGYDPLFVEEGEVRTFAELTAEEKNSRSHRMRALEAWLGFLLG